MATRGSRSRRVVAFDGDKLGQVAGAAAALIVIALQAFYRESDLFTTLVRAAWTFVGAYAAMFFLARVILRASLREMIERKRQRRDEVRKRRQEARERAAKMGLGPTAETESPEGAESPAEHAT